jgi:hypothetical protein
MLERDALFEEGAEHGVEHGAGNLFAPLDRVRPVHQYFRFDDRHQVLFLAYRARACAFAVMQPRLGSASSIWITARHLTKRAPMPRYAARRSRRPSKTLGDGLVGRAGERLRAGIDLDAGNDALARKDFGERHGIPGELFCRIVSSYMMSR